MPKNSTQVKAAKKDKKDKKVKNVKNKAIAAIVKEETPDCTSALGGAQTPVAMTIATCPETSPCPPTYNVAMTLATIPVTPPSTTTIQQCPIPQRVERELSPPQTIPSEAEAVHATVVEECEVTVQKLSRWLNLSKDDRDRLKTLIIGDTTNCPACHKEVEVTASRSTDHSGEAKISCESCVDDMPGFCWLNKKWFHLGEFDAEHEAKSPKTSSRFSPYSGGNRDRRVANSIDALTSRVLELTERLDAATAANLPISSTNGPTATSTTTSGNVDMGQNQ